MRRFTDLIFGVVSDATFFATSLYASGFIGGFGVPTTLDGQPAAPLISALLVNLGLLGLFAFRQPLGGSVWNVTGPVLSTVLHGIMVLGILIVLVSTFLINHFDLFGLRQVWLFFRGQPYTPLKFRTPGFYRLVRHPRYVGWFLAFWATPTMTMAHLLFAVMTTAYILVAIPLEERNLVDEFGEAYREYRRRVPMLNPFAGKRRERRAADSAARAA